MLFKKTIMKTKTSIILNIYIYKKSSSIVSAVTLQMQQKRIKMVFRFAMMRSISK